MFTFFSSSQHLLPFQHGEVSTTKPWRHVSSQSSKRVLSQTCCSISLVKCSQWNPTEIPRILPALPKRIRSQLSVTLCNYLNSLLKMSTELVLCKENLRNTFGIQLPRVSSTETFGWVSPNALIEEVLTWASQKEAQTGTRKDPMDPNGSQWHNMAQHGTTMAQRWHNMAQRCTMRHDTTQVASCASCALWSPCTLRSLAPAVVASPPNGITASIANQTIQTIQTPWNGLSDNSIQFMQTVLNS